MIITATSLAALTTGFSAAYSQGFAGVTPIWNSVATLVPSTTAENSYGWLGSWPKLREWIGERQVKNLAASGYTLRNRKFEATISVSADEIEDDQAGIYKPMFEEMGRSAAEHPDEIVFEALRNGFTAKDYTGGAFFGNHKVGKATVSNNGGGTGAAWFLLDCSRSLKPIIFQKRRDYRFVKKDDPQKSDAVFDTDAYKFGVDARVNAGYGFWQMAYGSKQDLTQANLRAAYNAMTSLLDDNGRPLGIRPTHLIVHPGNEFAARDILLASQNASGATNTDYNLVKMIATPHVILPA